MKMKHLPFRLMRNIQTSDSPTHQEENMMSYNPFENFDDSLFHDCGNEENYQKDLDEVSLAEDLNKTLFSTIPFEEHEVIQSCEEVINFYDQMKSWKNPQIKLTITLMISYRLGDADGIWVVSFFTEILSMTLKVHLG
jgi:hypothetical protein